ncbi:hypothetical protein WJX77_009037 [Trebouxia sp. C0004]
MLALASIQETNVEPSWSQLPAQLARSDCLERAHVDLASVEVRFQNLSVNAEVAVGARGEPTVLNAYRNKFENLLQQVGLVKPSKTQFCILDDFSGTLRPGRITLLLGPPGAGKSTLLNALAGRLQKTVMLTPACILRFSDQTHLALTQAAVFSWLWAR